MNPTPLFVRAAIWLWLIVALVAGGTGQLARLPRPALQGVLFALTGLLLLAYFRGARFRAWLDGLDLRALVLFHVTRFVGFYFLFLHSRGELPYAFAVPGGWGDNLVAALALVVCLLPLADETRRRAIGLWNVIGLTDIVLVLATGARIGLQDPQQLSALARLPLSLLPTFLVPLVLFTHVVIFVRLRGQRAGVPGSAADA